MLAQSPRCGSAPSAKVATTDIGIQRVNRAVVFVISRLTGYSHTRLGAMLLAPT